MDDLVDRLKAAWAMLNDDGDEYGLCDTLSEAAAALEAAQKLDRLAAVGTADGFLALPDDAKRRWFAASLVESSRRKKAEEALEAAREDAERYRWLRENCVVWAEDTDEPQLVHRDCGLGRTDWRERLDAAIDQARGKGGQEVGDG